MKNPINRPVVRVWSVHLASRGGPPGPQPTPSSASSRARPRVRRGSGNPPHHRKAKVNLLKLTVSKMHTKGSQAAMTAGSSAVPLSSESPFAGSSFDPTPKYSRASARLLTNLSGAEG
jgi:hypothetical protein